MPGEASIAGLDLQPLHDTLHSSFPGQGMSPFIHTASFKVRVLCAYTCPHTGDRGILHESAISNMEFLGNKLGLPGLLANVFIH